MADRADSDHSANEAASPIVGIGASAGGIAALKRFFSTVPPGGEVSFVVVVHLAPGRESLLSEILGRFSPLPTTVVEADTAVEPGHVYVIPPNAALTIKDGHLRAVDAKGPLGHRSPVDGFFASLAADRGEMAACVILSGTGSDGTLGLRAIKEHGGLALAQEAAEYDGMMRSAVATGLVDVILPAEEMPRKLIDYFSHLREAARRKDGDGLRREVVDFLPTICALLLSRTGHDFSEYKDSTIVRRIQRRMQVMQRETVESYVEHLRGDAREVDLLFRDLLIGVTGFFRDPEAFDALDREVIGPLLEGRGMENTIRAWVPGCSTGEEAYSVAMLLHEHLPTDRPRPQIQIFASDIDERALEVARHGRYPATIAEQLTERRLKRFFLREDGTYRVVTELRETTLFSRHDLLRDPPFSKLDLISCRNLLIYMNTELQDRVVPLFGYAIRDRGYLFLGSSENVTRHARLFSTVDKSHRIFRRRPEGRAHMPQFPLTTHTMRRSAPLRNIRAEAPDGGLQRLAEQQLLERFGPAHAVINEAGEVLHISAGTGKYLEMPAGAPDSNVLSMARPGLRLELRSAIHRATTTGDTVVRSDLSVGSAGGRQLIDLIVQPLRHADGQDETFLVVFRDVGSLQPEAERVAPPEVLEASSVQDLEHDLHAMTERLQSTTEELESSNQELRSANEELSSINEELQSSNEELETSKEELSSMNEELQTVNAELNARVEELSRANSDIQNLLESTQFATVFLDRELRIKKFTAAAKELFFLVESDEGRPISHMRARFRADTLEADAEQVLRDLASVERTVEGLEGGARYVMRIMPYRTVDDVIAGVVITFVDITGISRAQARIETLTDDLRHRVQNLTALLDLVPVGIFIWEGDGAAHGSMNRAAARLLATDDGAPTPRTASADLPLHMNGALIQRESQPLRRAVRSGESVPPFEAQLRRSDGSCMEVMIAATPLLGEDGKARGAIASMVDITERKQAELHQQLLLSEVQHRAKNILATISALARRMLASSVAIEDFGEGFIARLQAMARTHELLSRETWSGARVEELVQAALKPYRVAGGETVTISGPPVVLDARASGTLGMVFYEMASNAAKYGALASEKGALDVAWDVKLNGEKRNLRIVWKETVDRPATSPSKVGFGTSFIERSLSYELAGTASLTFETDGLKGVFEVPLDSASAAERGQASNGDGSRR